MGKLASAVDSLETAIALSGEHLGVTADNAQELLARAKARLGADEATTVAVFAGATGSGKSSLLNAIVGENVARVAPTRPTTSEPLAVSARERGALLDWLEVARRHVSPTVPQDLVVVDLPDIDSTEVHNRQTAARMIGKADALVWVLDPQKYADAVVHEDYLRKMAEHSAVMLVVLNQIDRVAPADREAMVRDVAALVAADGVRTEVFPVSAATGEGVAPLRARLERLASRKKNAAERIAADMRTLGAQYEQAAADQGGEAPAAASKGDFKPVARQIVKAAGGDVVAEAAEASYTRRARKATGFPLIRWIRRIPDPLERLHLGTRQGTGQQKVIGASSLVASPAARTAALGEIRRYVQNATQALPTRWRRAVLEDANAKADVLFDECDAIIATADLGQDTRPGWWFLVNALQWISTLCALAGLVWLVLLHAVDWLKIQLPEPPMFGIFPLPTLLLLGGLALCLLLWALASAASRRGARRLRSRVAKDLTAKIEAKAGTTLLAPIDAAVGDYRRFWQAVQTLQKAKA